MQNYHHQELSLLPLSDLLVNMKLNTATESPTEKNVVFFFKKFIGPDTLFFSMILSIKKIDNNEEISL